MIALGQILVATDFSPAADAALDYARALATRFGATLHVLHAAENLFFRATLADPYAIKAATAKRLEGRLTHYDRDRLGARAIVEVSDDPADAIVSYARGARIGLIIMGTHGREGVAHLLVGSVAERVVRTAPCPVLTIKRREGDLLLPQLETAFTEARAS